MTLDRTAPPDYLVGHIEDALARDERVCEQGLHVAVEDEVVTVTGVVSTEQRRRCVPDVVGELLPGFTVRNDTVVAEVGDDLRPEHLSAEAPSSEAGR